MIHVEIATPVLGFNPHGAWSHFLGCLVSFPQFYRTAFRVPGMDSHSPQGCGSHWPQAL